MSPRFFLALFIAASTITILVPHSSAQETKEWQPPEPSAKSFDWIKLKSGEWLKGEIKGLRDDDFEFDSDELDLLNLDWTDVAEFRSPRVETYFFEGGITATGPAAMKDGIIRIRAGDEVREFRKADLLSIIEGKPTELSYWSVKATLGMVGRSGNTDQSDFTANINIRRDAPKNRLDLGYVGNFGSVSGEQNVNNHRGTASINVFLYRNWFLTPLSLTLFSDTFQNIELQSTFGISVGAFIVRNKKVEFYLSLGGGHTKINYFSVQEGENDPQEDAVAIPVLGFEWDITDDIEWTIDYNSQLTIRDPGDSVHHFTTVFSVEIWGDLNFTTSASLDRVEQPKENAEGVTPVPNDLRVSVGLGVRL